MVICKVALWGRVWEHTYGYRAQYAYPLEFLSAHVGYGTLHADGTWDGRGQVPLPEHAPLLAQLAEAYGTDQHVVPAQGQDEVRCYGGPWDGRLMPLASVHGGRGQWAVPGLSTAPAYTSEDPSITEFEPPQAVTYVLQKYRQAGGGWEWRLVYAP
jgi:hypothetical protein